MKNNWRAFLVGVGSIFDLSGSITAQKLRDLNKRRVYRSDAEVLRADWAAIGRDMKRVMTPLEKDKIK